MARTKKIKKVLLLEPNYKNKFPPVGLMKIATYYRNLGGWEVVFYKGDLKDFVIERIVDKLIDKLNEADPEKNDWCQYKEILFQYVKTRKKEWYFKIPLDKSSVGKFVLSTMITDAKDYYWKGTWEKEPEWDRVGVTTLFTFYWDITIETIKFAKKLAKHPENPVGLMVGGVLASLQPKEIEAATGVKPFVGILNTPGQLDPGDTQIIDELEMDYSILDEIEYQYPMANSYYRYTTKGCIRHCQFCAVKTLEPVFKSYVPLKNRIERINNLYGEQKDLLLMDNNVLASEDYPKIIEEIINCGVGKGAKFIQPDILEIAIGNLKNGINDRAYVRKSWRLITEFYSKLKGDESYKVFCIIDKYHLDSLYTAKKKNLIAAYDELKELYKKHHRPVPKKRKLDFNQGLDARLFTQEKADMMAETCIDPVRIAFDDVKTEGKYVAAIKMCVKAGIKSFSNYLLYNFKDTPEELYHRLMVNIELCEELGVNIYSFPMKYQPLYKSDDMDEDYSHNRDFLGVHWNRKYIRVIQAILNSTKGKVGRGRDFFYKAFGSNIDEFHKLLVMPETHIIYRFFFEWLSTPIAHNLAMKLIGNDDVCKLATSNWWKLYNECKNSLDSKEWESLEAYINKNNFYDIAEGINDPKALELLKYYRNYRDQFFLKDSDIYKLKQEYDKNPTMELKWN